MQHRNGATIKNQLAQHPGFINQPHLHTLLH